MAIYIFYDSSSKMYLIYSTLCSIIAILSYASCYVMLAANIEDVRSLADKYIPENIADEILNRAREGVIRDRHIYEEDRATTYRNKHVNRKRPSEVKKHKSNLRITRNNDTKKYTSYEMNLDDLVAKVKKRLQIELKLIEASADKQVQARYKKQSRDDAEATNREISRLAHLNRNHRPQSQQSRDDDRPSQRDRPQSPKTQQSRDDTELIIQKIDRPTHHDDYHKPGTMQSDRPAQHDRDHSPEPQQSREKDRPTYHDRNHKSKTQQSKGDDLPSYHDPSHRPTTQQSRDNYRPAHHDHNPETDNVERQKRRPHIIHIEQENQSPEQVKNSDTTKNNRNKKTTERKERTTTESSALFEKVVLGKSKESSEEAVTLEVETQSPRYKSKTGKRIDRFAEVTSPIDNSKYKVLNVFSDEDPTTSKTKEGVYYYDEALNYDKKKIDSKNVEKTDENQMKTGLQRDSVNNEPEIEPYADQLELGTTEKTADKRDSALSVTVLTDRNKKREKADTSNAKIRGMNINKSIKKPSKATVIPKRDFYKISSPNYLLKMPIIGERYHFDEPIPEDDRAPENLKYIGNPPASINGKVVLSQ